MKRPWFVRPLELATATFRADGKPNYRVIGGVALFGLTQIVAVLLASWHDGTLFLPAPGRGLMQHYGAIAVLVCDAVFLVAAGFARSRFRLAMRDAPLLPGTDARRRWMSLLERCELWVDGHGWPAYSYALAVILGAASVIFNIRNTIHPELATNYSHDVFDGYSHTFGFVVFKVCIFTSWVIVFPIVGYLLFMMAAGTWMALHAAQRSGILAPRVTHPDGCYGFAKFGTLNVSILAPFLLAYGIMLSLWVTHAKPYESLLLPMAGMTVVFLLVSYFALYPLYSVIRDARTKMFDKLRGQATNPDEREGLQFAIERLCFETAKASPYDSSAQLFLLGMRSVAVGSTAITLFAQYRGLIGI